MKALWTEKKTPWTKTKTHVDFKLLRKITPRNYKDLSQVAQAHYESPEQHYPT